MRIWMSWVAMFVLVGCAIGNIGNGLQEQEPETMRVLTGRVVDTSGAPLAGVRVTGNGLEAVSNADGYWAMQAGATSQLPNTVTYFRRGYAPYTVVRSAVDPEHQHMVLQPAAAMRRIDVAKGAVIRVDSNGDGIQDLTLTFPEDFLSGVAHIDVTISALHPQAAEALRRFPGHFVSREMTDEDAIRDLAFSYGAVNVSFHQGNVLLDSVELARPVGLHYVLGDAAQFDLRHGDLVDLAWLDREQGEWIREREGIVVVQNGIVAIKTEVEHFTWWHMGQTVADPGCVTVALQSEGVHQSFARNFELILEGRDYFGAAPPVRFSDSGVARTTGRYGHKVTLNYRYLGAGPEGRTFLDHLDSTILLQERGNTFVFEDDQICQTLVAPFGLKPGSISGFVQDGARRAVTDTVVSIPELGLQTVPRPDGFYQFRNVPYSSEGVRLTVRAAPTGDMRIVAAEVINTQAETRVDLIADPHPHPPWFVEHILSNSRPVSGETVDFSFTVRDDAPGLSWSVLHTAGEVIFDPDDITEFDDGSVYELVVSGQWKAEITGPAQLFIQVRDATDQETELVLDVDWSSND